VCNDGIVGQVWSIYANSGIVDIHINVNGETYFETLRTAHHEITKITKEVADIMRGV
jgi:hypothetical protein